MNAASLKEMVLGGDKDEPVKRNSNAKNNNNNPGKINQAKQELKEKREKSKQTGHSKGMGM